VTTMPNFTLTRNTHTRSPQSFAVHYLDSIHPSVVPPSHLVPTKTLSILTKWIRYLPDAIGANENIRSIQRDRTG
jgi:hypothetical protein